MNLNDFKIRNIAYNWKTIFVGIEEKYFYEETIVEYALELAEKNLEDDFVIEVLCGTFRNRMNDAMIEIECRYCNPLDQSTFAQEDRKLRFISLAKLEEMYNGQDLLNKITEFYDNHNYPEEIARFVNYMPQKQPTTKQNILNEFHIYLKTEKTKLLLLE